MIDLERFYHLEQEFGYGVPNQKQMTALIVKEDGLIYVNEVPEEPKCYHELSLSHEICETMTEGNCSCVRHQQALASAKENAVLCADQEQARDLIFKPGMKVIIGGEVTLLEWAKLYAKVHDGGEPWQTMKYRLTLKSGIYPIPDLKWEVKERQCKDSGTDELGWEVGFEIVAILTLSEQPKGEESQVELWLEVANIIDTHSEMHRIPILMTQYTITRNLKENQ